MRDEKGTPYGVERSYSPEGGCWRAAARWELFRGTEHVLVLYGVHYCTVLRDVRTCRSSTVGDVQRDSRSILNRVKSFNTDGWLGEFANLIGEFPLATTNPQILNTLHNNMRIINY